MDGLLDGPRVAGQSDGLQAEPHAGDQVVVQHDRRGPRRGFAGEVLAPDDFELVEILRRDQVNLRLDHPVQAGAGLGQHGLQRLTDGARLRRHL